MQEYDALYQHYLSTTTDPDPMPKHIFIFHYQRRTPSNVRNEAQHLTDKKERAERRHDEVVKKQISKKLKAHHKKLAQQKVRNAINTQRIKKGLAPIMFDLDDLNDIDAATKRYHEIAKKMLAD